MNGGHNGAGTTSHLSFEMLRQAMDSMFPGFESDNWYGVFFPAGTSREIITKMNAEIVNEGAGGRDRDGIIQRGENT